MADQKLTIDVNTTGTSESAGELRQVSGAVSGVGKATEQTSKQTSSLGKTMRGLATGFAVYKGASFIRGAINETTSLASATAGLSRITGMDASTSSAWVAIAKERGVQSKQLNQGFITLAKNISSAAAGSKSSSSAFQQLGLDAGALKVQDAKTQMDMLADSFAALPAGVDKATLAQKLFGKQSQTLLPLLNKGSQNLNEQVGEMAKHTGMTNANVKEQLKLVAAQRQMNAGMLQLKVAIGTALIPILVALTQLLNPIVQGFAKLMSGSTAFRVAVVAVTAALVVYIATMKLATLTEVEFIATAAPWLALAVGIGAAFVMLYQKCGWFRAAVQALGQAAVVAFNWIKTAVADVFNWVKGHWPLLLAILGGPIGAAAALIIKNFGAIRSAAVSVFNFIKGAVGAVGNAISSTVGAAFDAIKQTIQDIIQAIPNIGKAITSLPGKALHGLEKAGGGALHAATFGLVGQTGLYAGSGGFALVGEKGPEMVQLPQGAQVHPTVSGYGVGGGGGTIRIPVYLDSRQIAEAMGSFVADQQAAR